ncbi:hypothetical protein QR680_015428 [Steinernema hermaphroditum]|uniref:C-type lectin domain-containing protein n=1 Tax=Steinernema hermaphroditum TaxID=289476 RepID=A0AA39HA75_9BILA|nr:hypothetical protein QR680_015428 [Steinernema hermaphroditum]
MLLLILLTCLSLTYAINMCEPEEILSYNGGKCFHFHYGERNFSEAQAYCEDRGGVLASIHNKWDAYTLLAQEQGIFWLGGQYSVGTWSWLDNSPFDFTLYPGRYPLYDCLVMNSGLHLWTDWDCADGDSRYITGFICEKTVERSSEDCGRDNGH